MVDWQMLEGIGGVATALAVIVAVIFGYAQYRQAELQRRQAATHEYLANFTKRESVDAIQRMMQLPDAAPPEILERDETLRRDIIAMAFAIESVGALVYSRTVDLHEVDRVAGGFIRDGWNKVKPFVEHQRTTWPSLGEWWQWLVERMEQDPAPGKSVGAHVAFRDWKR